MAPTRVLPIFSVLALVTVEYGGYALLRFFTGGGSLNEFQEQFFRAGHAHAGVLLLLPLVYFIYLERTTFASRAQWFAGIVLFLGIMCQSGGFFVHLAVGEPNRASAGTILTATGAVLIATALVTLAVGLIKARNFTSVPTREVAGAV